MISSRRASSILLCRLLDGDGQEFHLGLEGRLADVERAYDCLFTFLDHFLEPERVLCFPFELELELHEILLWIPFAVQSCIERAPEGKSILLPPRAIYLIAVAVAVADQRIRFF